MELSCTTSFSFGYLATTTCSLTLLGLGFSLSSFISRISLISLGYLLALLVDYGVLF